MGAAAVRNAPHRGRPGGLPTPLTTLRRGRRPAGGPPGGVPAGRRSNGGRMCSCVPLALRLRFPLHESEARAVWQRSSPLGAPPGACRRCRRSARLAVRPAECHLALRQHAPADHPRPKGSSRHVWVGGAFPPPSALPGSAEVWLLPAGRVRQAAPAWRPAIHDHGPLPPRRPSSAARHTLQGICMRYQGTRTPDARLRLAAVRLDGYSRVAVTYGRRAELAACRT